MQPCTCSHEPRERPKGRNFEEVVQYCTRVVLFALRDRYYSLFLGNATRRRGLPVRQEAMTVPLMLLVIITPTPGPSRPAEADPMLRFLLPWSRVSSLWSDPSLSTRGRPMGAIGGDGIGLGVADGVVDVPACRMRREEELCRPIESEIARFDADRVIGPSLRGDETLASFTEPG